MKYTQRSWKTKSKPRTGGSIGIGKSEDPVKAFRTAARTLPQGCRKDPVPWWDDSLDYLISERDSLREDITDPSAPGTVAEKRERRSTMNQHVKDTIFKLRKQYWEDYCKTKCNYMEVTQEQLPQS